MLLGPPVTPVETSGFRKRRVCRGQGLWEKLSSFQLEGYREGEVPGHEHELMMMWTGQDSIRGHVKTRPLCSSCSLILQMILQVNASSNPDTTWFITVTVGHNYFLCNKMCYYLTIQLLMYTASVILYMVAAQYILSAPACWSHKM